MTKIRHRKLKELRKIYKGKNVEIYKNFCPKCGGHVIEFFGSGISRFECADCDYDDYEYDF